MLLSSHLFLSILTSIPLATPLTLHPRQDPPTPTPTPSGVPGPEDCDGDTLFALTFPSPGCTGGIDTRDLDFELNQCRTVVNSSNPGGPFESIYMAQNGYEEDVKLGWKIWATADCSGTPVTQGGPIDVEVGNCVDVDGSVFLGIVPVPGKAESFKIENMASWAG